MEFITKLNKDLEDLFLLKHPFYRAWSNGELTKEMIVFYGQEYYHHVEAFPRYISGIHRLCNRLKDRQMLLQNLIDEEMGDKNHPELWMRFIEGVNDGSRDLCAMPKLESTKRLVDGFFDLTRENYYTGLGALYAYERQTPAVSQAKIEGLKKHYNICDPKAIEFFSAHETLDEWHTEALIKLICDCSNSNQEYIYYGAVESAKLLWQFLDGIYTMYAN